MIRIEAPPFASGLFTSLEPDPLGTMLGSDFIRFDTPFGISGLVRIADNRLDFLAVASKTPGRGAFRTLVEQAQKRCAILCVWEIMNPVLDAALQRYGFRRAHEREADGERLDGWRWDAEKAPGRNPA